MHQTTSGAEYNCHLHDQNHITSSPGVGRVRLAGQSQPWPASSTDPACDGLSVLTLNPDCALPPNALKDEQLFSRQTGFSCTLHVVELMLTGSLILDLFGH